MTHLSPARRGQQNTAGDLLRTEDIGKPLAATVAGHHRHAILIMDINGNIRFAATRGMFGRSDDELLDIHLQKLIPSVPLRATTPGYNVAYVRLAFAERGWHRHRMAAGGRGNRQVDISVRALSIGHSYALLAAIREVPMDRAGGAPPWGNALRRNGQYGN